MSVDPTKPKPPPTLTSDQIEALTDAVMLLLNHTYFYCPELAAARQTFALAFGYTPMGAPKEN